MKCMKHPTNTAGKYCVDCDVPLCVICAISKEHGWHDIIENQSIKDADEEEKTGSDFPDYPLKIKCIVHQQKQGEEQRTVSLDFESFIHRKCIGTKPITKESEKKIRIGKGTSLQAQLRKNEEDEWRIQRLINSLNIETNHHQAYQGDQMESTEYEDIIQRVDYLDCSGLHFSNAEKQCESFEPFLQFHFHVYDFLCWMEDCDEVFRKTQSAKCRSILSILFAAYTKEAMIEFKLKDISSIIDRCMDFAIENQNHILVLELVKPYIFNLDFHLQKQFKGKRKNSVVIDTLLQTAKYMILKECPRLHQNAINLSFCCECSQENRLVIILSYKGSIEMKDGVPKKAMGVNLVLYNYTQPSDEASTVFNSFVASCSAINLPEVTEKDVKKLFKEHSNLTLISASPFKSTGYSKGKHRVVEKPCISLLCLHKGYIPFGEREFPKQINGYQVDVQEGYCFLGSGRSIDFGGHIRRAKGINTPGNGSIGGFVDLSNDTVGLITCAHVVFSTDELKMPNNEIQNYVLGNGIDLNVEVFDKNQHNFQVCGTIVDKCFPLSSYNDSVDAALIKLDPSVNEFGFPITLAHQLYSAGFDPNKPPMFTGEVVNVPDPMEINKIPGKLDSVVKYGSKTGFTIGNLYFNGSHIRFVDDIGELPDKTPVCMCNQIEIQSLPHGTFFEPGDSGAFVFCINPDKTLSCIGMAIGSTSKGSCLVTPMVRILDSFGLPHNLKPCSPFVSGNNPRASENPLNLAQERNASSEVDLEKILLELQLSIMSMQTSITDVQNQQRGIQSSLHNVQTGVRNLNDKFQREIRILRTQFQTETENLRTEVGNFRNQVQAEVRNLRGQVQAEVGYLKAEVQEIKHEY
ncbi:uncharacterized protein LOC133202208 [Saccostrea echinata]|uniref:uncharacterized protein LOC133202208 n=1 Tax=Saccostrea echinata TaxID=191078 RepID=UPI002A824761|nr:uncharacterized protein LOC133202208 [Saccostrea echinata]